MTERPDWFAQTMMVILLAILVVAVCIHEQDKKTIARLTAERDSLLLVKTDWMVLPGEPPPWAIEKGDILTHVWLLKTKTGWKQLQKRQIFPDTLKTRPLRRDK